MTELTKAAPANIVVYII